MIGTPVEHPQYGPGQVVAVYKRGSEWLVRFESGLRFRRPRQEFTGEHADAAPIVPARADQVNLPQISTPQVSRPMLEGQFGARSLIEALRLGIAPAQQAQALTIGLEKERASLVAGLESAQQGHGAVRAVVGDYGQGKSHIVELTAQAALERNFLVAGSSLDLLELPPHRGFDIYASLAQNLRYPDNDKWGDERGLGPLLERATERQLAEPLAAAAALEVDPLQLTVRALATTASSRQRRAWERFLTEGRRTKAMNPALKQLLPKGQRFPSVYKVGHNARQLAYLLSGVSVLARFAGYSGLAVLIDEAESYSLLKPYQRPKAGQFFSAVIYAARAGRHPHLREDDFAQHRFWDYPLHYGGSSDSYGGSAGLFFLFTVTRSDNRLPLEVWLEPEDVLELEPHLSPQELAQFLDVLGRFHAQAYAYTPDERYGQLRRAAAEHLARGVRNHLLGVRGVVRLSVDLFDLLYLYPEYEVVTILDELRAQMR